MVLFHHAEEARRAAHDLEERGIPQDDMRLYSGEEILEIESRFGEERSNVARVVEVMTADRDVKTRYIDNARAGGAALWLFAPRKEMVDRSMRLLADHDYFFMRYYGPDGVEDVAGA
jgi:hypothetical protein